MIRASHTEPLSLLLISHAIFVSTSPAAVDDYISMLDAVLHAHNYATTISQRAVTHFAAKAF